MKLDFVPQVRVEPPPRPTLWLDTSVHSHLGKILAGKVAQDSIRERVLRIRDVVTEKVASGALLCIRGDQDEEIAFESAYREPIRDAMFKLTREVRFAHRYQIRNSQIYRLMEAYQSEAMTVQLPFSDAIDGARRDWTESGRPGGRSYVNFSEGSLQESREAKGNINAAWEALRQTNRQSSVTFDQQFEREQRSLLDVIREQKRQLHAGELSLEQLALKHDGWSVSFVYWKILTKRADDFDGFIRFLMSVYFHEVPVESIGSTLVADLLTGEVSVRESDQFDVAHLASVLPYCTYVVTDGPMAERLRRRKLGSRWGAKVFSLKQASEFCDELQRL